MYRLKRLYWNLINTYKIYLRPLIRYYIYQEQPIIVYQMGKVGSSTIVNSLENAGFRSVYHVHMMLPTNHKEYVWRYRSVFKQKVPFHAKLGIQLFHYFIAPRRKVKIITLVRDPISRNISAFFQNANIYLSDKARNTPVQGLIDTFINDFDHDDALEWFDKELNPTLNIDIYEHPFPLDQGVQRIQNEFCDILVLKLEAGDSAIQDGLRDFLGEPGITMHYENLGSEKGYADVYQAFKSQIELPKSYLDQMLNAKYTTHFYTNEEREKFRMKWSGN